MNEIVIKSSELKRLPIIGKGTEGTIYKYDNKTLFKIYHHYSDYSVPRYVPIYDEEGVNITPTKELYVNKNDRISHTIRYYNKDGVILGRQDAIEKAIERQQDVKKSYLPTNSIYVDGILKGCTLHYHRYCTNIYKTLNLPYKLRLRICRDILEKYKELIENNIYHIDLAQSPTINSNNTNVLLSYINLTPQIIDIDGQSAIYTEEFNEAYYKKSLFSLNYLLIELLSKCSLKELLDDEYNFENEEIDPKFPIEMLESFKENKLTLKKVTNILFK